MGGIRRFSRGYVLATLDSSISARPLAPHHRQYVDALDFRGQRRGPHGTGAIRDFLSDLRRARWSHAFGDQPEFYRALGWRFGRDCRRARRLSFVFSDGAIGSDVSDFLFSI